MAMKLAVIGSSMMDVVSYVDRMPEAGETRESRGFHIAGGGKGANQAVAAAKLGADVRFVTAVGDDMFGRQCRKNYNACGIDTSLVMTAEHTPNGVASITVEKSGQNRIIITKGANASLTPERLREVEAKLADCGLIVLQLEIPLETVYEAIAMGQRHHIPVLLNPAPGHRELDMAKAAACEFFVPNETELSIVTGMPTGSFEEIRMAAGTLLQKGLPNVIVTMGSHGSVWFHGEEEQLVPSSKVHAVDTTGAGDAFIGCFAASWLEKHDILHAMQMASRYAALSVTHEGTQDSYCTRDIFMASLKEEK